MPRNAQGVYSLPVGNPVIPGTLIETTWANPTMTDIAAALTGSLPRDGSAGMQGPLFLAADGVQPLEAVTVQQLTTTINGSNNWLAAGCVQHFAGGTVPSGWLECNGQAVGRATYPDLFAAIGTTYGVGDGSTTFNVPDLRAAFLRGLDNGRGVDPGRANGSTQVSSFKSHTHTAAVTDSGHNHPITEPGHGHGTNDPGHSHGGAAINPAGGGSQVAFGAGWDLQSIAPSTTGVTANVGYAGTIITPAFTGVGVVNSLVGGSDTHPLNVAMVACIKAWGAVQQGALGTMAFQNDWAVSITGGTGVFSSLQSTTAPVLPNDVIRLADVGSLPGGGGGVTTITSSDTDVLAVNMSNAANPILIPRSNIPNGMAKLNAAGDPQFANYIIGTDLLPSSNATIYGYGSGTMIIDISGNAPPGAPTGYINFIGDSVSVANIGYLYIDPYGNVHSPSGFFTGPTVSGGYHYAFFGDGNGMRIVSDNPAAVGYSAILVDDSNHLMTLGNETIHERGIRWGDNNGAPYMIESFDVATTTYTLKNDQLPNPSIRIDSVGQVTFPSNPPLTTQYLTASRTWAVPYSNNAPHVKMVMISIDASTGDAEVSFTVNSYSCFQSIPNNSKATLTIAVGVQETYYVDIISGTPTIYNWLEVG
jgi:microcystin-dependent protein